MLAIVFVAALPMVAGGLPCPDYASIAHPSVLPANGFSMKKLEGVWHILATTEPTVPGFCRQCGINNFTIYDGDYRYQSTMTCAGGGNRLNVTVPIGGHLGATDEPGNGMENFVAFNHTVGGLMPNMFFNYTEDWYMSYACGTLLGVMPIRSFFLATRNPFGKTEAWIKERIGWAKATGLLDGWENIATTDETTLRGACWGEHLSSEIMV